MLKQLASDRKFNNVKQLANLTAKNLNLDQITALVPVTRLVEE